MDGGYTALWSSQIRTKMRRLDPQRKRGHLSPSPKTTTQFRNRQVASTQPSRLAIPDDKCKWKRGLGKRQVTWKIRRIRPIRAGLSPEAAALSVGRGAMPRSTELNR